MDERNRNLFWLAAAAAFAIVCIPSMTLLDNLQRYHRFLTGFEPATMKPVRMRSTPRHADGVEPKLEFVEFRLKAAKAKKIELIGEFNGWKTGTLPLAKKGEVWELTVPLPPGRYHYLFVVDGAEQWDPANKDLDEAGGRPASVKVVR
jgi:1,4-alpha-glucan branching enzyme